MNYDYLKTLGAAVTVADKDNKIVYMNDKSIAIFVNEGGGDLIGQDIFECHNPNSQKIMKEILEIGKPNAYTIEKKGIKKFIYKSLWYNENNDAGLIEFSYDIPFELPHFERG